MTLPADDPESLSRLLHLNSEPWLNDEAYREAPYVQEVSQGPNDPWQALPPPDAATVSHLAEARRSVRAFRPQAMPLTQLATVLHCGYGAVGPARTDAGNWLLRRMVPSAGGLYPLDLYVLAQRVEGLAPGLYRFDPIGHGLASRGRADWQQSAPAVFYTWPFIQHAAAVICLVATFRRIQKKYGPRGYRYILLEAGHAAQNLCLAATGKNLATLCMGGFRDADLAAMMGLTYPDEAVIYTVALGHQPDGQ